MGKLNSAYRRGQTPYPRTEVDYLNRKEGDFMPHPKLAKYAEYCHPLNFSRYPLSMATVPLELTNQRISTPATLVANCKKVDDFFEEREGKLFPKKEKADELEFKLSIFYSHLEDMKLKYGDSICNEDGTIAIDKVTKDGAVARRNPNIVVYKLKLEPSAFRRDAVKSYGGRKKKRDNVENFKTGKEIEIKKNNYNFLIEEYLARKKLSDYLLRKRNMEYVKMKMKEEEKRREKANQIRQKV